MTSAGKPEYSQDAWISLLRLLKPIEYVVTVDHFSIWRRHLAWAKGDGGDLRAQMTQRFASNMVFMSLLLGAELNILFNSSQITTQMRLHMRNQEYSEIQFWIGVIIFLSVFFTLFTILSTFTAWGMVSAVSDCNAHCILRSPIGQYVTQLPSRLIVAAINSFILWVVMYLFVLLPGPIGKVLFVFAASLLFHLVIVYSAFGRLILHTGAMGPKRIFPSDFERALLPSGLHTSLLIKAMDQLRRSMNVTAQYRYSAAHRKRQVRKVDPTSVNQKEKNTNRKQRNASLLSQENYMIDQSARAFANLGTALDSSFSSRDLGTTQHTLSSLDSFHEEYPNFPRASVLNNANMTHEEIRQVVGGKSSPVVSTLGGDHHGQQTPTGSNRGNAHNESQVLTHTKQQRGSFATWRARRRKAQKLSSARNLMKEWETDNDARSLYDAPPAALDDDDVESGEGGEEWQNFGGTRLPRPSIINRASLTFSVLRLSDSSIPAESNRDYEANSGRSTGEGHRKFGRSSPEEQTITDIFSESPIVPSPSALMRAITEEPKFSRTSSFDTSVDGRPQHELGTEKSNISQPMNEHDLSPCGTSEQDPLLDGLRLQQNSYSSAMTRPRTQQQVTASLKADIAREVRPPVHDQTGIIDSLSLSKAGSATETKLLAQKHTEDLLQADVRGSQHNLEKNIKGKQESLAPHEANSSPSMEPIAGTDSVAEVTKSLTDAEADDHLQVNDELSDGGTPSLPIARTIPDLQVGGSDNSIESSIQKDSNDSSTPMEDHCVLPGEHSSAHINVVSESFVDEGFADTFRSLVVVKDRRFHLRSYKKCFVGREAVDMLVSERYAKSREEAVRIGRELEEKFHLFEHVAGDHSFSDDNLFYRFKKKEKKMSSGDEADS